MDDFNSLPDEVRQGYIARALAWFFDNHKGQPSLTQVRNLAKQMWSNEMFIKKHKG